MTAARTRQLSAWTTWALVALIVIFTLVLSPAEGDSVSRFFPGTLPFIGGSDGYDTCIGGISCQDGHALAFVALGGSLAVRVLAGRRGARALTGAVVVMLLLVAFATLDEAAQTWAGRDPSVEDWLADVSGAILGLVIGAQIARLPSLTRQDVRVR